MKCVRSAPATGGSGRFFTAVARSRNRWIIASRSRPSGTARSYRRLRGGVARPDLRGRARAPGRGAGVGGAGAWRPGSSWAATRDGSGASRRTSAATAAAPPRAGPVITRATTVPVLSPSVVCAVASVFSVLSPAGTVVPPVASPSGGPGMISGLLVVVSATVVVVGCWAWPGSTWSSCAGASSQSSPAPSSWSSAPRRRLGLGRRRRATTTRRSSSSGRILAPTAGGPGAALRRRPGWRTPTRLPATRSFSSANRCSSTRVERSYRWAGRPPQPPVL